MAEENPFQAPIRSSDPAPTGPKLSEGRYEFSDEENRTIGQTGRRARTWGVISGIIGGLFVLVLAVGLAFLSKIPAEYRTLVMGAAITTIVPLAIVQIVMARLYMGAGEQLANVVRTQGDDVELLMQSLDKLARAFRVEVIVTAISIVIGFVAGLGIALAGDAFKNLLGG